MSRGERSRPTRERSAEERERDREERARRRGQPPGEPPVPAPAQEPVLETPVVAESVLEVLEVPEVSEVVEPQAEVPVVVDPQVQAPAAKAPQRTLPLPPPLPPELGGPPASSAPARAGRTWLARLGAVLALAAAVAAVLLLAHSLRSKPTKTLTAPTVVKVLIPEGKTRAQIAEIAAADGLSGSYSHASKRSSLLSPSHYGAPRGTTDLEGFLFPATYDMNQGEPVTTLVEEQLAAFRENFTESEIARARALHITPYGLLTVASMVEREAQIPGDRAKIAAVIYNRLRQGVPLGIDATIYYAVEQQRGIATYTHELTEAELHIDSPYNTRTHTGLPPTPISNPGDASIHAAAYPAHVSYMYYVAAADGCGEQVFSNTLAEFEADDAAYRAAVKDNGGHPPSCKRKH